MWCSFCLFVMWTLAIIGLTAYLCYNLIASLLSLVRQVKGVGSHLWDAVVNYLQLLEADYFDLEYTNHNGDECWLDKDKMVLKQIGSADTPLRFCVKFYTPDPGLLEDVLTRTGWSGGTCSPMSVPDGAPKEDPLGGEYVKGVGSHLWDAVVNYLQLLEADYFDLEYTNHNGDECWLDKDKMVLKQIGSADTPLRFCVKFYTPDPGLLEDVLTRYLFVLQVRKDLLLGELRCSENTAALLASYVVQGEIGDFDCEEFTDPTYLATFKFVPEHLQTHEFMAKVMDYHRQHIGESPTECDLNLLDTARKVELYGVKMQNAKDHEGVSLNLAVAHLGVLVFQHFTKINTFSWAKVRKLSFKRKKFLIKLHADTYGYYKDTVEFFFDSRDRCKLFWKRCIEHHAFFRCQVVAKVPRNKTRMVSRGSSFRYCGRTQKQLVEYVRENIGKKPQFERSTSGRISSRSASVTPKISSKPGMHSSSADLHTSSGSRSSGSHILDSNHTPGARSGVDLSGTASAMREHSGASSAMRGGVESVDVHSDSSMSGSRSLNSPRLEHGLSIDQEVIEAVNARTEGAMTDEDDDAETARDVTQRHHGMAHVASETKGASSSSPSPPVITGENSPVRYVGLYTDSTGFSPDYSKPEALTGTAGRNAVTSVVSDTLYSHNQDGSDSLMANSSSSSPHSSSVLDNGVICTNRADQSVDVSDEVHACASSVSGRYSSHAPRSNLNLNLTNIITSSSSSSSPLPQPSSSVLSSISPTVPFSSSPSSTALPPLSSPSSTASAPHTKTTSAVPFTHTSTPLSASQNVGNVCISNIETLSEASRKVRSRNSTPVSVPDVPCSGSAGSRLPPDRQVSGSKAVGQQQQQKAGLLVSTSGNVGESLTSPPPPPPLQYSSNVQEEVLAGERLAGRHLVDSPSSCVTDIAETRREAEQRHHQQVRVSSSSRVSSLDSDQSSHSQPVSSSSPPGYGESSPGAGYFQHGEAGPYSGSLDRSVRKRTHKKPGSATATKSKKPSPPSSPPRQTKSKEEKFNVPNGTAVGAGAPATRHLEADIHSSSRKLSAGADLIEDIPYILHRRQDGRKEETSVFKASKPEARGGRQHRSVSPSQRSSSLSSTPVHGGPGVKLRSPDRSNPVPRAHSVPASVPSKERSRRLEFINMHKLPNRLSFSSVDDTTSPSGQHSILKALDQGSSAKNDSASKSALDHDNDVDPDQSQSHDLVEVSSPEPPAALPDPDKDTSAHGEATAPLEEDSPSIHNSESDSSAFSPGVQFYSPKIPGSQRLKLAIRSTSDESPDRADAPRLTRFSISSSASSENVSDFLLDDKKAMTHSDPSPQSHLQYFEVSKPQPYHGQGSNRGTVRSSGNSSNKDVPKSLPIKSRQIKTCDHPASKLDGSQFSSPTLVTSPPVFTEPPADQTDSGAQAELPSPPQQRGSLSSSRRASNSSETNQFLIDLPSPAAALFYSENNSESPPATKKEVDESMSSLTFSTFRPDPTEEEDFLKAEAAVKDRGKSPIRWALQEVADYKVIMTEGVVEKSALKKKKSEDGEKPREPKRVSWHEDPDLAHSYHSGDSGQDDDDNDTSFRSGSGISPRVNSPSIMETLENLRNQNSESDITNSGSSGSSSETESEPEADASTSAGQRVPDHGAAGGESTLDSGVSTGAVRVRSAEAQGKVVPLTPVEHQGSAMSHHGGTQDTSPLEPLERLCLGIAADNFDDEGEADDEDDEPNFPPPPPIVNFPEEMLQSYESDLPLPDPLAPAEEEKLQQAGAAASAAPRPETYSSDSDPEHKMGVRGDGGLAQFLPRQSAPRLSLDPLAHLEFGDLVADMHCTTSESESDFDADEANLNIRRLSGVAPPGVPAEEGGAVGRSVCAMSSLEMSLQQGLPLYSENPSHRAQLQQHQQAGQDLTHGIQKSRLVSPAAHKATAQPPKCHPKPVRAKLKPPVPLPPHAGGSQQQREETHLQQQQQLQPTTKQPPPPVFPRPSHLRQPQMGKGIHFDRPQRQKTSPSSSSSSSLSSSSSSSTGVLEARHHQPPPPAPPQS
ncbi:Ferm, rhogef and pleckstrin domain-containing protein 1-like [Plakobranchus ocellatus]|uniref:Ferm, rhogef and pleckstrin domain-containing protein 1-like n=1 Tax=Plakobranchus ocellatus TaxID=259542 RepID=A0AAV3YD24_9GAST|nr:Ferm, rhogef and pleckstrin domain-containing protein 1-like [Plakobranchus ocellatus]